MIGNCWAPRYCQLQSILEVEEQRHELIWRGAGQNVTGLSKNGLSMLRGFLLNLVKNHAFVPR